jgi:uncharacterized protein YecT (DUF1311 family)
MRLLVAGLALASGAAVAQYRGPAVDACLAQAKRQQEGAAQVVIERDANLQIAHAARKVGSQAVSAVLTGNGAVAFAETPSAELSFVCLLADEKRALFFSWLPRAAPSALASCSRSPELRARLRPCLENLQQMAEQELLLIHGQGFQQANERGAAAVAAFRKSNDAWRAYRDAECARRSEQPPQGAAAEDLELACLVELTRRRAAEMR